MSSYDSHIVHAIDNALTDWALSDDAMRWTPDPTDHAAGRQTSPYVPIAVRIGTHFDFLPQRYALGMVQDAMAAAADYEAAMSRFRVVMSVDTTQFRSAMQRLVDETHLWRLPSRWDKHHPRPLTIDGHAYHQRRKNRTRRR